MLHVTSPIEYFLLSSAAYADFEDAAGDEYSVEDRHDPLGYSHYVQLKSLGWKVIFSASGRHGYRGYAFVHEARREICVAHRGTQNLGSVMTDILAVINTNRTGHAIDAVRETLGNAAVKSYLSRGDWKLSTTGHSLGGWLATLFQFVVSDVGMGFYFSGQVVCRAFDAPGIGEFLNALQSPDLKQQVYIPGLDCINYVVRADIVNTLNRQTGTVICIEGDRAASPREIQELLQISNIHGRANIYQALIANDYKLIQKWPQTSSDVLAKLMTALSGHRFSLLGVTADFVTTAVTETINFVLQFFQNPDQTETYSDIEIQAARETLERAMQDDLRVLVGYDYRQERQMRHLPSKVGQFIAAYCAYKNYSVMSYLLRKLALNEFEIKLLNSIKVEKRAQADWVIFDSREAVEVDNLDDWIEAICQLEIRKPELLDMPADIWSYYDTAAQKVNELKEQGRLTGEKLQRLEAEVAALQVANSVQSAVIRIGCAYAVGKDSFAQTLWSLSADDLAAMEQRAEERAINNQISTNLFGAEAYGENAVALAITNLIPSGLRTEEAILRAFEKCVDSAENARRAFREDIKQARAAAQFTGGMGSDAERVTSSSSASGLGQMGMYASGHVSSSAAPGKKLNP